MGENDEWNTPSDNRTFFSKENIINIFENFEILKFEEIEKDRYTALGVMKHWHMYNVIAKKKLKCE